MEEVSKKIAGDWFDIRESMDNPDSLERYLGLTGALLRKTATDIRLSVEEGIVEFKRGRIIAVYNFIESFKYDSRGFDDLSGLGADMTALLFAVLMQRLIATGDIKRRQATHPEGSGEAAQQEQPPSGPEIKEVIAFIGERMKKDPGFATLPEVKNILMQVKIYQKEFATFNELKANILPEKAKSFAENFRNTFANITKKIQENYTAIIAQEERDTRKAPPVGLLDRHELNQMAPLLLSQAKEISGVRSTLLFAGKERYKTRDILATVAGQRDAILSLFSQEMERYGVLEPFGNGARGLARAIGDEVVRVIEKEIEWIALNGK